MMSTLVLALLVFLVLYGLALAGAVLIEWLLRRRER
jgi:hypothetical protein